MGGGQEYLLRDGYRERWGEFTIPAEPSVVGLVGKPSERPERVNDLADELERELKLRCGGATVADLAQVLEYGGLLGYSVSDRWSPSRIGDRSGEPLYGALSYHAP